MDEAWAKRLEQDPAVWAPHRPYGKYGSEVGPEGPGCCEFPLDHDIHKPGEPLEGWCFVCERGGMVLGEYRTHDGRRAWSCTDQFACAGAHARLRRATARRKY